MKKFMDENFLLSNETAVRLYHDYAHNMPIIDYHCHLNPQEIYENKRFKNLTEVWLYGDHYKWRAMRANGVEEKYVTGGEGVSDYDRFLAWAKAVPETIGNPLYHWSHLELKRLFGVEDLINEQNAPKIWEQVNAKLNGEGYAVQDFIRKADVKVVCTTDDPTDSLEYHLKMKEQNLVFKVLPSFRPDKFLEINRATFLPYVNKLAEAAKQDVTNYDQLLQALEARVEFFHAVGGRVSDHALDYVPYADATKDQAAAIFAKALKGEPASLEEERQYKTYTLLFLGKQYAKHGWAMQYHINAHRNNNSRRFGQLGPDTGYDSIHDNPVAGPLVRLLDVLDFEDALPRTILYSLNGRRDNDLLTTIIASFQGGGIPGKIQLGSGWWFNDTIDGMIDQMKSLANNGLLSRFVGMLTDSRSFLSYTRHEYFRRILCNLIGEWVERGEAPNDLEMLGGIVQGICYRNAEAYFRF